MSSNIITEKAFYIVLNDFREIEWLFATPQGRQKLQESAKFQRLAVVTLLRDQQYESLDAVKLELADSIKSLAPLGLKDQVSNFYTHFIELSLCYLFLPYLL